MDAAEWARAEALIKEFCEETGRPYVPHIPARKRLKGYRATMQKVKELKAKAAQFERELACYDGARGSCRPMEAPPPRRGKSSPVERELLKREEISRKLEHTRQEIARTESDLQRLKTAIALLDPTDREILQRLYFKGETAVRIGADLYLCDRAVRARAKKATEMLDRILLRA